MKVLSVENLGEGISTPIIGNQGLGLDADLWSRNEKNLVLQQ